MDVQSAGPTTIIYLPKLDMTAVEPGRTSTSYTTLRDVTRAPNQFATVSPADDQSPQTVKRVLDLPGRDRFLGPAGIGKTALIHRFLAGSGVQCVLSAKGEEAEAALAFGVIEQLARTADTELPQVLATAMSSAQPHPDPLRVGADLIDMLGQLQADGPIILVIDDVNWADNASLQALSFAVRRLRVDQVLTLFAVRAEEAHRVPQGLRHLLAAGRGALLRLSGLDPAALRELGSAVMADRLSMRVAERVHALTGGNPLHARALFEDLPPEALNSPLDPLPAPRSYGLLVLSRLAACPPETEQLVAAVAVLGLYCSLRLAGRLAGVEDPLRAVEPAIRATCW